MLFRAEPAFSWRNMRQYRSSASRATGAEMLICFHVAACRVMALQPGYGLSWNKHPRNGFRRDSLPQPISLRLFHARFSLACSHPTPGRKTPYRWRPLQNSSPPASSLHWIPRRTPGSVSKAPLHMRQRTWPVIEPEITHFRWVWLFLRPASPVVSLNHSPHTRQVAQLGNAAGGGGLRFVWWEVKLPVVSHSGLIKIVIIPEFWFGFPLALLTIPVPVALSPTHQSKLAPRAARCISGSRLSPGSVEAFLPKTYLILWHQRRDEFRPSLSYRVSPSNRIQMPGFADAPASVIWHMNSVFADSGSQPHTLEHIGTSQDHSQKSRHHPARHLTACKPMVLGSSTPPEFRFTFPLCTHLECYSAWHRDLMQRYCTRDLVTLAVLQDSHRAPCCAGKRTC